MLHVCNGHSADWPLDLYKLHLSCLLKCDESGWANHSFDHCSYFAIWLVRRHSCRWSTMKCIRISKWMTPTPICPSAGRVWCRSRPNCTKVSQNGWPWYWHLANWSNQLTLTSTFSSGTSLRGAEHWYHCGRWWQCLVGHQKESSGIVERIIHWKCAGGTACHRGQQRMRGGDRQRCRHQTHPLERSSG